MSWFENLTGCFETSPEQVREQLSHDGEWINCPNGERLRCGRLETPTLQELRTAVESHARCPGRMTVREIIADARQLHADPANAGALFQVASQFNLLEMAAPSVVPERGVGIYEDDPTQGPACAIACGGGTIYRNYFVPVGGRTGQSADIQIDCLHDMGKTLGNSDGHLWAMQNGYLLPTDQGLREITAKMKAASESGLDSYRGLLRIGIQWEVGVTVPGANHHVSQAYCAATPVAYSRQPADQWAPFARLILEAAYEATICAAILNASTGGSRKLFLTLLGGGVFGNRSEWITDAIKRAIDKYRMFGVEVAIVSYGASKPAVADLVHRLR